MSLTLLSCPICKAALEPLTAEEPSSAIKTLRCVNNHCFDKAKQDYWNLLVVQQKKSKDPGDNAQMVAARRAFLDLNHYQALAQAVSSKLGELVTTERPANILDMGCGEGYYTDYCQQLLNSHNFIGLDISKHAIKTASRRNKAVTWLVASGANMPVPDDSLDIITVIFSRLMPQALANKLTQQGILVLVWPNDQHLIELKQAIYTELKISQYDPAKELATYFTTKSIDTCAFQFQISSAEDLSALLLMTPHGQKVNAQMRASLAERLPLSLSFNVNIGCFEKR